jgi:hypothetical protein
MKGDYTAGKTVIIRFNTHKADGTPITLAGTPAVSVYKNSTTESTAGVTLTVDYDSRTGLHHVAIDTSTDGTFYAAGSDFDVVITAGTVDSISVVGTVVGSFSLANRAALRPTVADRTLDVTATGAAGVDWGNVENPTTTLGLTGTTISTGQTISAVSGAVGSVTGAVGSVTGSVASVTGNVGGSVGSVVGAVGSVTGNVGGNVTGSVGSVASGGITSASFAAGAINAAAIADSAIDRATFAADTGLQTVRSNTAQAGASTSITLDASASSTTDYYDGCTVFITGGTGVGQYRLMTAYNGTTKVATVTPAWATNPDNTSTFAILPRGIADLAAILNVAVSTSTAQLGVNAVQAGGTAWGSGAITAASIASGAITSAKFASGAIDAAAIFTGAITSTKFAAGAIDAAAIASGAITNAKFAAGAIDAAAIAADAIGASELATDAVTEIATAVANEFATAADSVQASPTPTTTAFAGSSSLSATDDFYNGSVVVFSSGTLDGLARKITDYVGSTRTLTVSPALPSAPASAVTFRILGRID